MGASPVLAGGFDKQGLRRNFARCAASYDCHAGVQQEMGARLLELGAAEIRRAGSILEVGCGTGWLTQGLRSLNPGAAIVAVDLDLRLLRRARERLGPDRRTLLVVADGEALAGGPFDLVIGNAVFQWFSRPGETLAAYHRLLGAGGALAFATLGPATFRELAWSLDQTARLLGRPAPPGIPAQKFPPARTWRHLLNRAGFSGIAFQAHTWRRPHATVENFLQTLRATGATNPTPVPLSPRFYQTLLKTYRTAFGENGSVPVSYEVMWFLARKEAQA